MKIFIIGAGFTGTQLAKKLINEKNDVILIDNDENTVRHASNRLDCTVIQADGNNIEVLLENGISSADALVAVTENDEVNMITCSLVDTIRPNILKIARVRNYAYYANSERIAEKIHEYEKKDFKEKFLESNRNQIKKEEPKAETKNNRPLYGIDFMIHPDIEAAEAIVKAVEHGAISDVLSFGDSDFELTALPVEKGSKLDGIALKNLHNLTTCHLVVSYVETTEGTSLPSGETILKEGDRVGILAAKDDLPTLLELCGSKQDLLKKILLVGAGRIGTQIADHIFEKKKSKFTGRFLNLRKNIAQDFVIVDSDEEICKIASERYPQAKVFCGDITDEGFIEEEGLDKFNLIICATHNHEMNMVVSAYMESLGVEKSIALVAHSAFIDISRKLGIDVAVPLRDAVVDSIMSHLRGRSITGIHTICNGDFEIVECDLPETSKVLNKTLKDIAMPGEYLMLLMKKHIEENKETEKDKSKEKKAFYELPDANYKFQVGDHIVLIEKAGSKKILEKFNGVK